MEDWWIGVEEWEDLRSCSCKVSSLIIDITPPTWDDMVEERVVSCFWSFELMDLERESICWSIDLTTRTIWAFVFSSDSLMRRIFLDSISAIALSTSWDLVWDDSVDGAVVFDEDESEERRCFLVGSGGKSSSDASILTTGLAFLDFGDAILSIGIEEATVAYDISLVAWRPKVVAVIVLDNLLGNGKLFTSAYGGIRSLNRVGR